MKKIIAARGNHLPHNPILEAVLETTPAKKPNPRFTMRGDAFIYH